MLFEFGSLSFGVCQIRKWTIKMPNKRKKNTLTLKDKVKILEKIDKGVQGKRLALDFNVTTSTISYIKSNRKSILDAVANTYQHISSKTLHSAEYPKMESRLYEWFLNQREKRRP